jgi:hypothetical protein
MNTCKREIPQIEGVRFFEILRNTPYETQLELLSPLSKQDISQLTFPNKKKLSRYFDL